MIERLRRCFGETDAVLHAKDGKRAKLEVVPPRPHVTGRERRSGIIDSDRAQRQRAAKNTNGARRGLLRGSLRIITIDLPLHPADFSLSEKENLLPNFSSELIY